MMKKSFAILLAICMTFALLPVTAFAVTSNTIYAVSYGHGVVSADTYSAAAGTKVKVTLEPDASRLHMGWGSTAIDPAPYVMQQQMQADMKYVSASPSGTVADVNSTLPATSAYTAGTTVDSDNYSGAAAYYPINFVFAITNDSNATEITLTHVDDTTYTFTMPDAAVKIVAGFGSVTAEPNGARDPITGSPTNRIQMGNPGARTSYLDFAVEMRTDLKFLYYPSYLENVFDFTDGQALQIAYPAEGANTYGSFLLSVLGVARDYSGTKQISLSETSFVLPSSISQADADRKMFSVTGDGSGNFSVRCLLTSNSVVTSPYCTAIYSHETKSKQVDTYIYSPDSLFVGDPDASLVTSIVNGYYYTDRLTTVSDYKTGVSFAFKYGSSIPDEVWLGDMDLVDGDNTTYWVNNTATGSVKSDGASASNFNAKYEPATRTLTINGLDVEGSFTYAELAALSANCDLNVVVKGTNKIINTYNEQGNSSFGILVRGQLHFSGSGTLTTKAGDGAGSTSVGIYSSDSIQIALAGGTINAYGRGAVETSCGVLSSPSNYSPGVGNLMVTSGTLNAYAGNTTADTSASMGMFIKHELIASGGTTTATGGTVTGTSGKSYGVSAGTAEISSAFTATGGAAQESTGIKTYQLLIKGGALATVTGGSGDDSTGIFAVAKSETEPGVIIITGGEVIAKADINASTNMAFNIQPGFFDAAQTSANWCKWRLSSSGDYTSSAITPYTLAEGNSHVEITTDDVYIKTQPQSKTFTVGSITGALTVEADGSLTGVTTYQWYQCDNAAKGNPSAITGAAAASFTIPTDLTVGTYYYYCTAALNSVTADSNVAVVTVNPVPDPGPTYSYYAITAAAGENGAVTPAGKTSVREGGSVAYAITPDENYRISDVLVDGVSVGAVSEYTFENVEKAHTIEAVFVWDNPFEDVAESDWFHGDVEYACLNKLFEGTSPTSFAPHTTMTRGMLVTVLYRLGGEPAVTGANPFDDVARGKYYESAVIWAAQNDIVGGYDSGKFGPEDDITREQLAAILWRYAKYKGYDVSVGENTNILSYNDVAQISEYALPAMQWACGAGLIQGSDGNLMPKGNALRCQVAAILHRFCQNIVK